MNRWKILVVAPLLLLGMQLGAQLHALEHDGERLARPHDAGLVAPTADDICPICALLKTALRLADVLN